MKESRSAHSNTSVDNLSQQSSNLSTSSNESSDKSHSNNTDKNSNSTSTNNESSNNEEDFEDHSTVEFEIEQPQLSPDASHNQQTDDGANPMTEDRGPPPLGIRVTPEHESDLGDTL